MSDDRPALRGLHHVTAICGDPQPNVDFWVGLLGLRLVKRTVNFDDPGTWHLYYGDNVGTPGTLITFFPWASLPPLVRARGRAGAGQIGTTMFAIPTASWDFWSDRIAGSTAPFDVPEPRFGERRLVVRDPDGIAAELVATDALPRSQWWPESPVPAEHAIAGIRGVAIVVRDAHATRALLEQIGFRAGPADSTLQRYELGTNVLDVDVRPDATDGRMGIGAVHHVAWRTDDARAQQRWRDFLMRAGVGVTDIRDRQYFQSIYFQEPGGVIFEIATDGPGFTRDEPVPTLGSELRLPPWLEERRPAISAKLPDIHPPRAWRL
ncbi:MAG TPA: VOC family protein [Longimicrobiales bacterium]